MTENENSLSEWDNLLADSPIPDFVIAKVEKKQSLRQTYAAANGKQVSLDFFLFTSFEEEQTLCSFKGKFRDEVERQRWPVLSCLGEASLEKSCDVQEFEGLGFSDLLDRMCAWYKHEKPLLAGSEALDYEIHGRLTRSFSLLFQDIACLVLKKTEASLKYPPSSEVLTSVWDHIHNSLTKTFPVYAHLMEEYLRWRYKDSGPVKYDLATLPPVGRFTPLLQREARKARGTGVKSGAEIPKIVELKNDDHDLDLASKKTEIGLKSKPKKSSETDKQQNEERELEAQSVVAVAVETLKTDLDLASVCLAPCNSYLRRLQHKFADEAGFSSQSVGTGAERSVEILRR